MQLAAQEEKEKENRISMKNNIQQMGISVFHHASGEEIATEKQNGENIEDGS